MLNNKAVLVWIFVLAVLLLFTPVKCPGMTAFMNNDGVDGEKEGFYTYYGYYKKYCGSSGWRSRSSCSKCTNAGWCISPGGYGECVPGDSKGPYFRDDCQYWEYGDPYYYYPYSHVFPSIKVKSISPYYRYRIRKPYRWRKKGRHHGRRGRRGKK